VTAISDDSERSSTRHELHTLAQRFGSSYAVSGKTRVTVT
jgi:hypothetical protein